jgi:hypothetical protein
MKNETGMDLVYRRDMATSGRFDGPHFLQRAFPGSELHKQFLCKQFIRKTVVRARIHVFRNPMK